MDYLCREEAVQKVDRQRYELRHAAEIAYGQRVHVWRRAYGGKEVPPDWLADDEKFARWSLAHTFGRLPVCPHTGDPCPRPACGSEAFLCLLRL